MTSTATGWATLDTALDALRNSVAGVSADDWHRPTPCTEWTVRQVVEHAAGDQLAWASVVGTAHGPAYNPFAPSGSEDGSGEDLVAVAVQAATAAWSGIRSDAGTVPTPLPQGALPPAIAAVACALDAAIHAWDVAVATGQPSPLSDDLAAELRPAADAIAEPLRGYGVFAAVVPGPMDDGPAASLLRYLGRDPQWSSERFR
jgi:uncharacterized protein (TIGR03086 family)